MFTRQIRVQGPPEAWFIETSSPGMRGQSGGPVFDVDGRVWGIQRRTHHLDLGFSPRVRTSAGETVEHQFLIVGIATHPSELIDLAEEKGVRLREGRTPTRRRARDAPSVGRRVRFGSHGSRWRAEVNGSGRTAAVVGAEEPEAVGWRVRIDRIAHPVDHDVVVEPAQRGEIGFTVVAVGAPMADVVGLEPGDRATAVGGTHPTVTGLYPASGSWRDRRLRASDRQWGAVGGAGNDLTGRITQDPFEDSGSDPGPRSDPGTLLAVRWCRIGGVDDHGGVDLLVAALAECERQQSVEPASRAGLGMPCRW
jgi:hypothetical protein